MVNYQRIRKSLAVTSLLVIAIGLGACYRSCPSEKGGNIKQGMSIKMKAFGQTSDRRNVDLYTLTNSNGLKAEIMTYGGIVLSLEVPDSSGNMGDIVLGYDALQGYIDNSPYFGAIVGRYANRIGGAKFSLDGKEYILAANDGVNHLHGGKIGFDKVVWQANPAMTEYGPSLILSYTSQDGEEGYPGTLKCKVTYTLTNNNELKVEYSAVTDKNTICNLTQHSYFNLAGQGSGDILSHKLMINADKFTPIDETLITTGELRGVSGTVMDFTKPTAIGARVNEKDQQLIYGLGYDHNWVLNRQGEGMMLAARVSEPTSGRVMEVYTTEPGIQLYGGNFLDGTIKGKGGKVYNYRNAFCLETQHYPDSPNKPNFPTTTLLAGDEYSSTTVYKFSVK